MTDAPMQFLYESAGRRWYFAEPGKFTRPGLYFWNGATNVHIEDALQAATNACKLTECQGQPRCRYCVAKDARAAATGGVRISDDSIVAAYHRFGTSRYEGFAAAVRAILAEAGIKPPQAEPDNWPEREKASR